MKQIALILLAVAIAGCDPSAKAEGGAGASARGQQSSEYESCASSSDCVNGLHCADAVCRASNSVIQADYYAALGETAFAGGDQEAAITAYAEAVNLYRAANTEPPLALYCAQGHVLVASRSDQEIGELAARVLHRCARLAPVGTRLRERALRDLSLLGDVGIDPLLLATESADKYLIKAPKTPRIAEVTLALTGSVRTRAASYAQFQTDFGSAAMRDKLLPCWKKFNAASGKLAMAVTFRFKTRYSQGRYENDDGYKLGVYDSGRPTDPADLAATACAKPIIEQAVAAYPKGKGRWDGDVTFTLTGVK